MDGDIGTMILLIVLIVSAFLLILIRFAKFINDFGREKQYLLNEMHRAADYNEYRYWRRELRCLYLCLIPFVTERNVMKVYPVFFHRAKHATKEKRSDGLVHILAPSMLAICLCAICLCGASWAWFTASTSTGTTAIRSSSYKLFYQIGSDKAELAEAGTAYTLPAGKTVITLKAAGTAGATGYCSIKIGDETYYTEQISVNDTSEFTFTVNAAANTQIILTPKWGTYSHGTYSHAATPLHKGEGIAAGSQQSNTQAPDNTVTAEPSTEPAPTTPTAPTTPSSTPTESTTTAPEPSATAPTEHETTDTEPAPAPETTAPENKAAAQTEPPTEESESN
jgi:hypothetical protein